MDINIITVFILAIFVGFEIITKVPPTLHTPLMSGSNAISGIAIVGFIISSKVDGGTAAVGLIAVIFATVNVVGGFYGHRPNVKDVQESRHLMDYTNISYVLASVLFILGIKLSHPKTARNGNFLASVAMLIAIAATLVSMTILISELSFRNSNRKRRWNTICHQG